MICRRCGKELGNVLRCNFCGYDNTEGNVREMTNIEKKYYDGVTIDAGSTEDSQSSNSNNSTYSRGSNYYSRTSRRTTKTFYTYNTPGIFSKLFGRLIDGLINNNTLAKVAATLIVVALGALMFFIAVPILFVMLALGIALFTFAKFGR